MPAIEEIIKILLIISVYFFIFIMLRYIYLDLKIMKNSKYDKFPYLKLLNRKNEIPYKIEEVYNLYKTMKIGRDIHNDIVINDKEIENYHAEIEHKGDEYYIHAAENAPYILLNGVELEEKAELRNKDIIQLGNIEFLFIREIGD